MARLRLNLWQRAIPAKANQMMLSTRGVTRICPCIMQGTVFVGTIRSSIRKTYEDPSAGFNQGTSKLAMSHFLVTWAPERIRTKHTHTQSQHRVSWPPGANEAPYPI